MGPHRHHEARIPLLESESTYCGVVNSSDDVDLLFVGVSPADRFQAASEALRAGTHVFLEWPPASSLVECERLVDLAEEAGLEVVVSRPLRAAAQELVASGRSELITLNMQGASSITSALADAIDLTFALAGGHGVRRVEAQASREADRTLRAAAVTLRLHSGAFAHILIRTAGEARGVHVYAAGVGHEHMQTVGTTQYVLEVETRQALEAAAAGRSASVSALDALQTLRIVERVMNSLR